ncbi:MAG: ferrous iron transport protein A [Gammaproteobacteria bacterium]|nr:ferrous iron transport protein A [Gammaproteobacteria bacterium]MCP5198610.1 ferrous iron transport protein A [Gammaproteobacteria bacterium]
MSAALTALSPGQAGDICGFTSDDVQRLMEMGLVEGTTVEVLRYAPAGDPVEIRVMGYALSLRKAEAACILLDNVRPA